MAAVVRRCGPRALLVEVAGPAEAVSLSGWLRRAEVRAVEVVPAATTVLLDGVDDLAAAEQAVRAWRPEDVSAAASAPIEVPVEGPVEVPVVYDGADLAFVAERWGCSVEEVVERHTGIGFTSVFCGFAPGFAYLTGLPSAWAVPRRDSPRTRVPAGSVALAGDWCGVYPSASPGGWRLLGHTDLRLWDVDRPDPALLAPGTRVVFRAC